MLTNLKVHNFKVFRSVEIELGSPVVFIGPNNSGKTTALQALALWDIGRRLWLQKRTGKKAPEKRSGVTINRRDLIAVPVPDANLLWRDLHVRNVRNANGKPETDNVRIDVVLEGVSNNKAWICGLEFDYANQESFYCRLLRTAEGDNPPRMSLPDEVRDTKVAFLPPMSGLAANETRLDPGAINVRIGEGRTAEVLRNLCYLIYDDRSGADKWGHLTQKIEGLFRVKLDPPQYIVERGEIEMTYRDPAGVRLDLSSSGRGLQQTLLLLAHLTVNPGSVLLLDEPDAHLEVLRQRQIYQLLTDSAQEQHSQIIAASHSEVVLDEAAGRDVVVAFVGKPHRIDDRGTQVLKSLKDIGFEDYYQAEENGWVLYLEGSTDLAILSAFAAKLKHPAQASLERPFVRYVVNQPWKAYEHYYGLREAMPSLVSFAVYDRLGQPLQEKDGLTQHMWKRREIENYLCSPRTLLNYAEFCVKELALGPLFEAGERERYRVAMQECIEDLVPRAAQRDPDQRWWHDTKASDDFLDPLFEEFFDRLKLPNLMRKTHYHQLAPHVPLDQIDAEVSEVLDRIWGVARKAVKPE